MSSALAVARHLKRAQRLLRDATREAARAADVDTVAHLVVRGNGDLEQMRDLLELALAEHDELDVIIFSSSRER
jgi:hypothetical protein